MPYVTIREAADQCGLSAATIRSMINRGEIPAYRLGRKLLKVKTEDLPTLTPITPAHAEPPAVAS